MTKHSNEKQDDELLALEIEDIFLAIAARLQGIVEIKELTSTHHHEIQTLTEVASLAMAIDSYVFGSSLDEDDILADEDIQ